ncbi:5498_t:CDS:2 [Entrophospora sp. SA101]|nr:5498_t:CDS:2 [Entrophospora sp. SA101]
MYEYHSYDLIDEWLNSGLTLFHPNYSMVNYRQDYGKYSYTAKGKAISTNG